MQYKTLSLFIKIYSLEKTTFKNKKNGNYLEIIEILINFKLFFSKNNAQLLEIFRRYDLNHNDKIEFTELRNLLMSFGWKGNQNSIAKMVFIH